MPNYPLDNYYETISDLISKIDITWFAKKEADFISDAHYDKRKKIIYHKYNPIFPYSTDLKAKINESRPDFEFYDSEVKIDLRSYCSRYLPIKEDNEWGQLQFEDKSAPPKSDNILEVADELTNKISIFLKAVTNDVVIVSKFVTKTLELIKDEISKLKDEDQKNELYSEVLNDFLNACSKRLYQKYSKELQISEITNDFIDRLDFNTSQEELVSLLYILASANILIPTQYEYGFTRFCFKYFTVIKANKSVRLTNKKAFVEAYRKILRNEGGKGVSKIKSKLMPVLKEP